MINNPFFSVVMPVYNVSPFLREAIESIIKQSFNNFELLLINDGSTDNSLEICHEYSGDPRVIIFDRKNVGLSATRNYALEKAKGMYIIFVDSDDFLSVDALESINCEIRETNADLVIFSLTLFEDVNDKRVIKKLPRISTVKPVCGKYIFKKLVLNKCYYPGACFMAIKANTFSKNGIEFDVGYIHEDEGFTPQVIYSSKSVIVLNKCFYFYRHRTGSITKNKVGRRNVEGLLKASSVLLFYSEADVFMKIHALRLYLRALRLSLPLMNFEELQKCKSKLGFNFLGSKVIDKFVIYLDRLYRFNA